MPAFPGNRIGEVFLSLVVGLDSEKTLIVRDNGVGLPEVSDSETSHSLGLQLVHDLTAQMAAELEIIRDGGTEYRITFREEQFR